MPVFNSPKHAAGVAAEVLRHGVCLIAVNDGSTDDTQHALESVAGIEIVAYAKNRGKGYALRHGFKRAISLGFTHAITIDADGQHRVSDIDAMTQKACSKPDALIVGARQFDSPNMPVGSRFANRFSNFWFMVQTGIALPDTHTGFRVYPLKKMGTMRSFTNRYEAELEMLVRAAWKNIKIIPQPINVYYPPPDERLSHFCKNKDFIRISLLNVVLCLFAVVYGYPSMLIRKFFGSND